MTYVFGIDKYISNDATTIIHDVMLIDPGDRQPNALRHCGICPLDELCVNCE